MKKLTNKKIANIIARRTLGYTNSQIATRYGITERRVRQLYSKFKKLGRLPRLEKPGIKSITITKEEEKLVLDAYNKYKLGAYYLERIINIPHNKIHKVLKMNNLARDEPNKQKRKKWVRYEREHSLSLVHLDWHEFNGKQVLLIEDDASRLILTGIECEEATMDNTIKAMKKAIKFAKDYGSIKQALTDNGSQFTNTRKEKEEYEIDLMEHEFEKLLACNGIQHIYTGLNHPQTNGKLEKLYDLYDKKRMLFNSLNQFIKWYNEVKPHRSLDFDIPANAFRRKLRTEIILGLFSKLVGWSI